GHLDPVRGGRRRAVHRAPGRPRLRRQGQGALGRGPGRAPPAGPGRQLVLHGFVHGHADARARGEPGRRQPGPASQADGEAARVAGAGLAAGRRGRRGGGGGRVSVYSAPWYTPAVQRLLDLALEEDVGRGDVTSAAIIDETQEAEADIVAGERAVVCGLGLMEAVFTRFDWRTRVRAKVSDGDPVAKGTLVASVRGPAQALLAGE